jgi:pimeloyl-ACP methyl ester carboxylesterase
MPDRSPPDRRIVSPDGRLHGALRVGEAGRPLLLCVHGGGCGGDYFDMPGFSVAATAAMRRFSVLRVDRPGHGASPAPQTDGPIDEAALLLPGLIAAARAALAISASPLVVVGHSIGAAVALRFAATTREPLAGLIVSGLGDRPSAAAREWLARLERGEVGHEPSGDFFFGPEGSYTWRGPAALRRAGQPWRADEVIEVMRSWPDRFAGTAAQVRAPVLFRLAEHERIWCNDPASLDRIAAAFCNTAGIDVGILPDGGHLYEIHRRGPDFVAALLDFADHAAASRLAQTPASV